MATMKDIAREANVSLATVSAVINRSTFVSSDLTNRVNQAIKDLNYSPNAVARSLKKKSTNTVGVIVSDLMNPYYPAMLKGVDDHAIQNNYSLILCNTSNDRNRFLNHLKIMVEKRVDGLILANISNARELKEVESTGLKFVLINRKPSGYDKSYVGIHNQLTSILAIEHLVSHGYKRIAFLSGDSQLSTFRERKEGFITGMQQNNLMVEQEIIYEGDHTKESGYLMVKDMISKGIRLPDAIFTASDVMAFGAYQALKEQGIRVPNDIALMGNDNVVFSDQFVVPLSTISHPTHEIGVYGMEILLKMLNEEKMEGSHKQIILTPKIIVRNSCGCNCDS
jgi:DNA-binding LacI/PurR family transcriptional regulator